MHIHHSDFNCKNDSITNLVCMPADEHMELHGKNMVGKNNPYNRLRTSEWERKMSSHPGPQNGRYSGISNEDIESMVLSFGMQYGFIPSYNVIARLFDLPHIKSDFRLRHFGKSKDFAKMCAEEVGVDFVYSPKQNVVDSMMVGNHKVVSIEDAGFEDVYNITVDDNHNYFIITSHDDDGITSSGILSKNCGEVFLRNMQFCNLSIANVRSDDTLQSLTKKVRLATIWGTIQACVDKYVGLRKEWSENQKEERLLGVDLNGLLDNEMFWPGSAVKEVVLASLKSHAKNINKLYAARFGINPAVAITCNKPAGNSSVFFDTASGIHPRFAKYYIRRIVLSTSSSLAQFLMSSGVSCEPTNGMSWVSATTAVFDFYVDASKSFVSEDMGLTNMLDHWLSVKQNWAEHNPSSTIYYSDNEFDEHKIKTFLGQNQLLVSGITFLPKLPNIWAQAPYQEITKEQYEFEIANFPKIDWDEYKQFDHSYRETMGQEYACVGGSCEL